jgi:hypothetical protein
MWIFRRFCEANHQSRYTFSYRIPFDPSRELTDDQVLIKVIVSGSNPKDWKRESIDEIRWHTLRTVCSIPPLPLTPS